MVLRAGPRKRSSAQYRSWRRWPVDLGSPVGRTASTKAAAGGLVGQDQGVLGGLDPPGRDGRIAGEEGAEGVALLGPGHEPEDGPGSGELGVGEGHPP